MTGVGKYALNASCDWCGKSPAREIVIQTNGVKTKRYTVTASACAECERRLTATDND